MTRRTYLIATALLCGACRFGGPDGNTHLIDADKEVDGGLPREEPDPDEDDDSDEGSEPTLDARARDGGPNDARTGPGDAAADDAADGATADAAADDAATDDAAARDAAADDAATTTRDGSTQGRPDASVASCDPPPDLACDPVSGEGCLPLMQCLADPSSSAPAAFCVLGGIQLGGGCTQDTLSTNCPAQHTCVMGQCRKYCYCDANCDDGAACTDPSGAGSTRFKVCE